MEVSDLVTKFLNRLVMLVDPGKVLKFRVRCGGELIKCPRPLPCVRSHKKLRGRRWVWGVY